MLLSTRHDIEKVAELCGENPDIMLKSNERSPELFLPFVHARFRTGH